MGELREKWRTSYVLVIKPGVTSTIVRPNHIDVWTNGSLNGGWCFTGIYGEPSGERKHLTWDYLRELDAMMNLPWLITGDDNEIHYSHEKEGEAIRPQCCIQVFHDAKHAIWMTFAIEAIPSLGGGARLDNGLIEDAVI